MGEGADTKVKIVPDTWVTLFPFFWDEVDAVEEVSVMDERLQVVARRLTPRWVVVTEDEEDVGIVRPAAILAD